MRLAQSMDEMLPILLSETLALLDTRHGSIWMYSHTSNMLEQRIAHGASARVAHRVLSPVDGIVGHTFTSGRKYIASDYKNDPLLSELNRESILPGLKGIFIPIQSTAGPVGVLTLAVEQNRQISAPIGAQIRLSPVTSNSTPGGLTQGYFVFGLPTGEESNDIFPYETETGYNLALNRYT